MSQNQLLASKGVNCKEWTVLLHSGHSTLVWLMEEECLRLTSREKGVPTGAHGRFR